MAAREIKFRVWDAENGKWFEPTYEAYKGRLEELLLGMSGDLCLRTIEGLSHESTFPDRFKLMQYTGLKDKNGVEIYEGDILKVSGWENEPSLQIRQVVWKDGAGFALEPNSAFDGITFSDSSKDFEVIGNIYENPELLK